MEEYKNPQPQENSLNRKIMLQSYNYANIASFKIGTTENDEIENVKDNPADRDLARWKIEAKRTNFRAKKSKGSYFYFLT